MDKDEQRQNALDALVEEQAIKALNSAFDRLWQSGANGGLSKFIAEPERADPGRTAQQRGQPRRR